MKFSTRRILTTHTGSLPRPQDLLALMTAKEAGEVVDRAALDSSVRSAVTEVVREQVESRIEIINDGEMSKIGYSTYVKDRLSGFEGESPGLARSARLSDLQDFPTYAEQLYTNRTLATLKTPACIGPIAYRDIKDLTVDIENLKAAISGVRAEEVFMSSASPGVISLFLADQHYGNDEAYLAALADAMKTEYDTIQRAGFLLQIDCPDLAMGRHIQFADLSLSEFRKKAALHVEALNHALAGVPASAVRIHLCWGNYEGPHHRDVPIKDIIDIVLKVKAAGISFEAANPRHEHEWRIWEEVKLPEGKVLIPGVLDSCTNYIEHPELIAERIIRLAKAVGRENVIAGTDCGFATFAGYSPVEPKIAWAKLKSMAEGARIASRELWRRTKRAAPAHRPPERVASKPVRSRMPRRK